MGALAQPVILAAACIGVAIPLLVWALLARPEAARQRTINNLQRDFSGAATANAPRDASSSGLADLARSLTPVSWLDRLDRLHARAGRPSSWPMERILVTKIVLLAGGVGVTVMQLVSAPSVRALLVGALAIAFCAFLPDLLLLNRGIKRRQVMALALPDTMDQLSIAVEAGLGFESALNHVARKSDGPLADELVRTLQDIQVGVPRRVAYLDLAERSAVTDLRRFVRAIIQAEQHGISIAKVLETQAAEMRIKRRQRAEETAMKIPVKVVFPLFLCILPALLVVVVGPAIFNMIDAFTGGLVVTP